MGTPCPWTKHNTPRARAYQDKRCPIKGASHELLQAPCLPCMQHLDAGITAYHAKRRSSPSHRTSCGYHHLLERPVECTLCSYRALVSHGLASPACTIQHDRAPVMYLEIVRPVGATHTQPHTRHTHRQAMHTHCPRTVRAHDPHVHTCLHSCMQSTRATSCRRLPHPARPCARSCPPARPPARARPLPAALTGSRGCRRAAG
jgi:hypothetical protein